MDMLDKRAVWPGWETVRLIGRGSYGSVFEIRRNVYGTTERAALKLITIPQNDSDYQELRSNGYDEEGITESYREYLDSIIAEYTLMRELDGSANVVRCDDLLTRPHEDGIGWDILIKMELLTPLRLAMEGKSPEELALRVGTDIGRALVLCKKHNIIHRDIKPANIFVSEEGVCKLGDFGIAKTVEKTSGGTKIGTYNFMAPEVYHDEPYGQAADVYSLGLVLYWLLNERRLPFLPLPPERVRIGMEEQARRRRLSGEALPAPIYGSEALKRVVLKACAYAPQDRYASAEALLRDLEHLDQLSVGPLPASRPEAAYAARESASSLPPYPPRPVPPPAAPYAPAPQREAKKDPSGLILFPVLLLAALGAFLLIKQPWRSRGYAVPAPKEELAVEEVAEETFPWVAEPTEEASPQAETEAAHEHVWAAATCTEPAICTICGETKGTAAGHDWSEPRYTWASDYSSVTAERHCRNDGCGETETETARTSSSVAAAATCTAKGKTRYTASFANSAFFTQTKTVENIPALGHSKKAATYTSPETCTRCGETWGDPLTVSRREQIITDAKNASGRVEDYHYSNDNTSLYVPEDSYFLTTPIEMYADAYKDTDTPGTKIYIMPMPESGHGNLGRLSHGTRVTVVAQQNGYYFFILPDGRAGWAGRDFLSKVY